MPKRLHPPRARVRDMKVIDSSKPQPVQKILAYEYFGRSRDRQGAVKLALPVRDLPDHLWLLWVPLAR